MNSIKMIYVLLILTLVQYSLQTCSTKSPVKKLTNLSQIEGNWRLAEMYSTIKSMAEDYKCARYTMTFQDNKCVMDLVREKNLIRCPIKEVNFFYDRENLNSFIYSPNVKEGIYYNFIIYDYDSAEYLISYSCQTKQDGTDEIMYVFFTRDDVISKKTEDAWKRAIQELNLTSKMDQILCWDKSCI